eukprot:jgi/Picsp_1/5816/NSC_03175-R1_---NA---
MSSVSTVVMMQKLVAVTRPASVRVGGGNMEKSVVRRRTGLPHFAVVVHNMERRRISAASPDIQQQTEQLREEIVARTAAMENLEQQLLHVEALRAEELQTAIARFEELEEALDLAEKSISASERRTQELKGELSAKEGQIKKLEQEVRGLQQLADSANNKEDAVISDLKKQLVEAQGEAKKSRELAKIAEEKEAKAREAARKELEASEKLIEMAKAAAAILEEKMYVTSESEDETDSMNSTVSETDLEVLLAELDLLRGELEAELQTSETALERARVAEAALEQLKKFSTSTSLKNEEIQELRRLTKQVADEKAKAVASTAEVSKLRILLQTLEAELAEVRKQRLTEVDKMSARKDVQKYISDLEARNQELAGEAAAREAAIAEGRKFLISKIEEC